MKKQKTVEGCFFSHKKEREKTSIHKFAKRAGFMDSHHLKPGRDTINSNLLKMDLYRHDAWHLFFGRTMFDYVIELLEQIEKSTDKRIFIKFLLSKPYGKNAWRLLFHNNTLFESIQLLKRVKRMKESLKNKII